MLTHLTEFYNNRIGDYVKDPDDENFLLTLNQILQKEEIKFYKELPIDYPFIFVFGLPRSGTTLLTQFIAHSFDIAYINNLMARFWLAPLFGIRLSKNVISKKYTNYSSDYARTADISDIHEFGYFWRYWLKKEKITGITEYEKIEKTVDWEMLRKILSNMQYEFNKPLVFKNIFGSYHIQKICKILDKVLFVYIERDELDVAISILNARKKYYNNLNTWWSYMPPEYDRIKDLDYMEQIAGQIFYLKEFYHKEIEKNKKYILKIDYRELCENPYDISKIINNFIDQSYHHKLNLSENIPQNFPFRTYTDEAALKKKFKSILYKFKHD